MIRGWGLWVRVEGSGIRARAVGSGVWDAGQGQGWELTCLVHEVFQQGRELSRESVQLNSGSRDQDRFNKVQLKKDLMIREPH